MLQRRADLQAGRRVPQTSPVVVAACSDGQAVGTESHGIDSVPMLERWPNGFTRGRFPLLCGERSVFPSHNHVAVGADGDGLKAIPVLRARPDWLLRGHVPQAPCFVHEYRTGLA